MTDTLQTTDEIETRTQSIEALKQELEAGRPMPTPIPSELDLRQIRMATLVFQPRTLDGNRADVTEHITALKNAMKADAEKKFDAITVWWSGKTWRILDGHCRTMALWQLHREDKVAIPKQPVAVFEGTLAAAMLEADRLNSKDKLALTVKDKTEAAWRSVAFNDRSQSLSMIAKACGVGDRTVSNMRAKLKEYNGSNPEVPALDMTWEQISKRRMSEEEFDVEAAIEKAASQLARRMGKAFGRQLGKNPQVTARAIEMYSERLPKRLIQEWHEIASGMAEEFHNPEDDF